MKGSSFITMDMVCVFYSLTFCLTIEAINPSLYNTIASKQIFHLTNYQVCQNQQLEEKSGSSTKATPNTSQLASTISKHG